MEVFVRRGLVPDGGGAYLLPRLVGPQKAKELMFFGDSLPAAEAERLGLVNLVVPADELEKTARAWAERLATGPTRALALTKRLVNAVAGRGPRGRLRRRGDRAGDQHDHGGRARGRRLLRRAAYPAIRGAVERAPSRWIRHPHPYGTGTPRTRELRERGYSTDTDPDTDAGAPLRGGELPTMHESSREPSKLTEHQIQ